MWCFRTILKPFRSLVTSLVLMLWTDGFNPSPTVSFNLFAKKWPSRFFLHIFSIFSILNLILFLHTIFADTVFMPSFPLLPSSSTRWRMSISVSTERESRYFINFNIIQLYFKGESGAEDQAAALVALGRVLVLITRLMAPFTPFFCEYIWKNLRKVWSYITVNIYMLLLLFRSLEMPKNPFISLFCHNQTRSWSMWLSKEESKLCVQLSTLFEYFVNVKESQSRYYTSLCWFIFMLFSTHWKRWLSSTEMNNSWRILSVFRHIFYQKSMSESCLFHKTRKSTESRWRLVH